MRKTVVAGTSAPKKRRWKRNLLIASVVLIGGGWLGTIWITHYLEGKLQEKVAAAGLVLTYDAIDFDLFPPRLSLDKVKLKPAKSDSIFAVTMGHAEVGIGLSDIVDGSLQHVSKIELHDGQIAIFAPDSLETFFKKSPDQVEKPKEDWTIANLDLRNIGVMVAGEKGFQMQLQALTGSLAATYADSSYRFGILKEPLELMVTHCKFNTLFQYHGFTADTLTYAMESQMLRCAGIHLYPKVTRDFLEYNEPYIALHADLTARDLVATGFTWSHTDLVRWHVTKMQLNHPVFTAFQDQEKPFKPGERPMPPAWMAGAPFEFMMDTLLLKDAALTYIFTRSVAPVQGKLSIDQWNLIWLGYGNDNTRGKAFTAQTSMDWMNTSKMKANVTFPYNDPDHSFQIDGFFTAGDFAPFNSVMEAAEGFHFITGHVNSLRFSFRGNDKHIQGKLWIDYEDVKVGFTKEAKVDVKVDAAGKVKLDANGEVKVRHNTNGEAKVKLDANGEVKVKHKDKVKDKKADVAAEKDKPKGKDQVLKGFVANNFAIRTSTNGEIKEIEVNAPRNPQQSVISLWLRGLMTGLKAALMR